MRHFTVYLVWSVIVNSRFKETCLAIKLLLFAVSASHCHAQDTTTLLMIRKVPLVEGTINGKRAYFLVDTGASVTVLNEAESRFYGFRVYENKYFGKQSISGIGGECSMKEARLVRVKLGCREILFINKTTNLDVVSRHFRHDNIRIAGIIGTDLLTILGCKIDYKTKTIVF